MELAAQAFPEIATDPNAEMAFKAIVAVTSNGASVQENAENSFAVYQDYRATGGFPDFGSGKESPSKREKRQRQPAAQILWIKPRDPKKDSARRMKTGPGQELPRSRSR